MKKITLFSLLSFSCLLSTNAQTVDDDSGSISLSLITTKDSKLKIVEDFKSTASKHFLDPSAPRFLLYDQKRDVAFGIGGYVRLRSYYDFAGSPSNSFGFIPYSIPVPSDPSSSNKFGMDVSKSTLFFKLLGNDKKLGQYQVYMSGNFTGDNNNFTLNDAYISLLGFTVGRTWSTFNDLAAVPPTVDFQGPNGAAEMRTEQIRYTYKLKNGLSFAAAIEVPNTSGTYTDLKTAESTQRIPDIPVYAQYSWGKGNSSHVRAAGVFRSLNYRSLVEDKTKTATGYGVQMSSKIVLNPILTLYAQGTYGEGIAQYINDLSGNGLDLIQDGVREGKMKALEAIGWFGQAQFNLSKTVYTTLGYSQAKVFPKSEFVSADQYRYGQYVVGNVFYNVTGDLQLGAEYLWGNRVNMNGDKNSANCIQAVMQFNF